MITGDERGGAADAIAPPWRMLFTDAGEFPVLPEPFRALVHSGIEIVHMAGHREEEIIARGVDCDGLYLFRARINGTVLASLPRCKLLARVGAGYDLIDVAAAKRRGVMVTYVPDFCTEELSEHVILFILAFARRLPALIRAAADHRWLGLNELPVPRRAAGQTLGILGFGRSGQRTATLARALGLDVLALTRTPRPDAFASTGARPGSFAEVMGCDYVALQLPLTAATRGLIDRDALRLMKPTAVLINVARGAIVDTRALVAALREGSLAGAALDVVDPAPLPPTHPLWDMPNVLITSHSAGFSEEAYRESLFTAAQDTLAVARGLPPQHPVPEWRDSPTDPSDEP